MNSKEIDKAERAKPLSVPSIAYIENLISEKGADKKKILSKYKKGAIDELTRGEGQDIIDKLRINE